MMKRENSELKYISISDHCLFQNRRRCYNYFNAQIYSKLIAISAYLQAALKLKKSKTKMNKILQDTMEVS